MSLKKPVVIADDDPKYKTTLPTNLSYAQLQQRKDLIQHFRNVFSKSDRVIFQSTTVHPHIDLMDGRIFKNCHHRISQAMIKEVYAL